MKRALAPALVALTLLATGCSSSGDGGEPTPSVVPDGSTTTAVDGGDPASSSSSSSSSTVAVDPAELSPARLDQLEHQLDQAEAQLDELEQRAQAAGT